LSETFLVFIPQLASLLCIHLPASFYFTETLQREEGYCCMEDA
jgi:hypothetical protein